MKLSFNADRRINCYKLPTRMNTNIHVEGGRAERGREKEKQTQNTKGKLYY